MRERRSPEDVARLLDVFADAHAALGDGRRRVAYARAAETVRRAGEALPRDAAALRSLPGVGARIASRIEEFLRTGRVKDLDRLLEGFPREFHRFVDLPGIGPKTARKLKGAGVESLDDLERAAKEGRLAGVVSARVASRILEDAPKLRQGGGPRALLARAAPVAERLLDALRAVPGVEEVAIVGSVRRRKPTIGDVDLVAAVAERDRPAVGAAFLALPDVVRPLQEGDHTRATLANGMEADLWLVDREGWGAALSFGTGSRAHTLKLRRRALARGASAKRDALVAADGRKLPASTEEAFYASLGLSCVPPELREDMGEVEAAERGDLPRLVERGDLRADLHMHTTASDGAASLDEMVAEAARVGHAYVAVTDHAHGLAVPPGMTDDALLRRKREVARRELPIPVLVGSEVNVLADGSLSLDDATMEELDVVIASVHSGLADSRARLTRRVVDALSTDLVDVLGHATNRRNPWRKESDLDFDRVIAAASAHDVALEVNGSPERMDPPARLVKRAKDAGLRFVIDSDAHRPRELRNLDLGVAAARRGWLTREDVLTTRSFDAFRAWLDRRS